MIIHTNTPHLCLPPTPPRQQTADKGCDMYMRTLDSLSEWRGEGHCPVFVSYVQIPSEVPSIQIPKVDFFYSPSGIASRVVCPDWFEELS